VYVIGPADVLNVAVAYEPELTAQSVVVDSNGEISLPLTGTVRAAGKTSSSLAQDVAARLGTYLRDPRVTVNIVRFARQAVTVEGSVIAPGIYDLPVSSSLLRTLALAKGPTNTARLNEVIVFRNINGQRMGAVFDLRRIRRGFEPDPLILGGDIVVVGYDDLKGAFRDFVAISPALSVFRRY
jgi:polysaccharide export outer membrane protein